MTIAPPTKGKSDHSADEQNRYPVSDGKPMAETEKHRDLMIYCITALQNYYADQEDIQVSGNNFVYYEEGNPKARISPDCYVVFGVDKRNRDSYMAWRENGRLPDVVFEFTSKKTQKEDVERKRPLYEQVMRVPEYFQFDPTADYLTPRLQGFRLIDGRYERIAARAEARGYCLRSAQLNVDMIVEGDALRFYRIDSGEPLLAPLELMRKVELETRRADRQQRRADAEARRADALIDTTKAAVKRADAAVQRADALSNITEAALERADLEAERADAEARRADAEAERADALSAITEAALRSADAEARRADIHKQQVELEARRADANEQKAVLEAEFRLHAQQRAEQAEAEMAQMRTEIAALRKDAN